MQKLMHQCIKSGILSDGNISGPFCTAESAAALVFEQRFAGKYAGRQAVVIKPGVNQECCGIYLLRRLEYFLCIQYTMKEGVRRSKIMQIYTIFLKNIHYSGFVKINRR